MSLQYIDETEGATSMFGGYAYVVDLKDNKIRPSVARMYVSISPD